MGAAQLYAGSVTDWESVGGHGLSTMGVSARREREKAERRAAIIDAAEHVFISEGFEASTMEHVAARAEVSKGTLYLYFESKDDLRSAIAERWVSHLIVRMRRMVMATATGLDGMGAVIDAYDAHYGEHPNHCRIALSWLAGQAPPPVTPSFDAHRARVSELVALVVATVERGQADGTIRVDVHPHVVAFQLWASFLGIQMMLESRRQLHARAPSPLDFDEVMPSFKKLTLDGLRPRPTRGAGG